MSMSYMRKMMLVNQVIMEMPPEVNTHYPLIQWFRIRANLRALKLPLTYVPGHFMEAYFIGLSDLMKQCIHTRAKPPFFGGGYIN